jgi:TRAP-type C4-dicarboxylate transport system permease small subunit
MSAHAELDLIVRDTPSAGLLGTLQAAVDGLNNLLAVLSALAVGAAGLILTWEVIGRYLLAIPSDWQDESSVFLLVGATFLSAAWTQRRRGHVGIDALSMILPAGADRVRRVMADLASAVFCGFFAWKSFQMLAEVWEEGQTTPSALGAPLWVPYACMTAGMALLTLQLLLQVPSHGQKHP